ncbi:MAG TPA: hypothetical protein PKG80_01385 [Acidobacteriota bacterium]|nr:hypothetical protein [Acidobacteriota bacterium]
MARMLRRSALALGAVVSAAAGGLALWLSGLSGAPPWLRARPAAPPPAEATPRADQGDPRPDQFAPERAVSSPIASYGGELAFPEDEARLVVPPGALSRTAQVEATLLRGRDGNTAIDLRPDGLPLTTPATLELPLPPGRTAEECEIAVYVPAREEWVAERPVAASDDEHVAAAIMHFSLRRVRIRPGMNFPPRPGEARGALLLPSDLDLEFQRFADGAWRPAARDAGGFAELVRLGRAGRADLIASGRLRAVAGPRGGGEVVGEDLRAALLPAGLVDAASGWVRIVRLDPDGAETGFAVVARAVVDPKAPPSAPVRLTRAALEALGLEWGEEFGVAEGDGHPFVRLRVDDQGNAIPYVPLRLEPWRSESRAPGGA